MEKALEQRDTWGRHAEPIRTKRFQRRRVPASKTISKVLNVAQQSALSRAERYWRETTPLARWGYMVNFWLLPKGIRRFAADHFLNSSPC
jgi:hypothetical protein